MCTWISTAPPGPCVLMPTIPQTVQGSLALGAALGGFRKTGDPGMTELKPAMCVPMLLASVAATPMLALLIPTPY